MSTKVAHMSNLSLRLIESTLLSLHHLCLSNSSATFRCPRLSFFSPTSLFAPPHGIGYNPCPPPPVTGRSTAIVKELTIGECLAGWQGVMRLCPRPSSWSQDPGYEAWGALMLRNSKGNIAQSTRAYQMTWAPHVDWWWAGN